MELALSPRTSEDRRFSLSRVIARGFDISDGTHSKRSCTLSTSIASDFWLAVRDPVGRTAYWFTARTV